MRTFEHFIFLRLFDQACQSSIGCLESGLNFSHLILKGLQINLLLDVTYGHFEGRQQKGQGRNQAVLLVNQGKYDSLLYISDIVDALDLLVKIQAILQKLNHGSDKTQLQNRIFLDVGQVGNNRVVRFNHI